MEEKPLFRLERKPDVMFIVQSAGEQRAVIANTPSEAIGLFITECPAEPGAEVTVLTVGQTQTFVLHAVAAPDTEVSDDE